MFDAGKELQDSPTGHIVVDPEDLLNKRYKRGNSESIRQLSVRVRVATEEVKKYRLQNEDLRKSVGKLNGELEQKEVEMKSMQEEYEKQIDELRQQLTKKERDDKRGRFEAIMSLLQNAADCSKIYEPPYAFLDEPKPEITNAEAQTDDWMMRAMRKLVNTEPGAVVAGPSTNSQTLADTNDDVIRCEKLAEEVAKLENEKFFLTTQLKLTKNKLENFELQEAQKASLENRLVILTEMNDCLVKENERLKEMIVSKMTAASDTMEEKRKIVDVTLECQAKLDEMRAELNLKMKQLQEQLQINRILTMNQEGAKEHTRSEDFKVTNTCENADEVSNKSGNEIGILRDECAQGDDDASVKILHMRMNPLDIAHQEYLEFQANRKRKLCDCSSFSGNTDDLDVAVRKKQRSEMLKQITDLQFQLHKMEKEKERALKIQSNLVKKYRAFVTALSGLQIKMKDDDLVQVESIFDPGNFFVFKVYDYGKMISLLETDYTSQWTSQIREYLEGRNSTPAFLAAITLILDERAQSTTTVSFYPSD